MSMRATFRLDLSWASVVFEIAFISLPLEDDERHPEPSSVGIPDHNRIQTYKNIRNR